MSINFDKVRNDLEKGEITINQARVKFGLKPMPDLNVKFTYVDNDAIFRTMMAKYKN